MGVQTEKWSCNWSFIKEHCLLITKLLAGVLLTNGNNGMYGNQDRLSVGQKEGCRLQMLYGEQWW